MPVDHTNTIIDIKDISYSYIKDHPVLENVSLQIHKGDYLGVIGPNGGGKSTLLKLMLGLLQQQQGSISLFGKNIKDFREWYRIAYVAQKAINFDAQFPLTVREAVEMGRYGVKGLFKSLNGEDKKIVDDALEKVDLHELSHRMIGDLSGGQQQRIFIARALAAKPDVIILDEPTVGVDAKVQEEFYALLKTLNIKMGLTLVLVSHDINVIVRETTEVACVNKTLVYNSNPNDFLKSDQLKQMYGDGLRFVFHHH
jgi:zinc transport system ATP-binding protein